MWTSVSDELQWLLSGNTFLMTGYWQIKSRQTVLQIMIIICLCTVDCRSSGNERQIVIRFICSAVLTRRGSSNDIEGVGVHLLKIIIIKIKKMLVMILIKKKINNLFFFSDNLEIFFKS